MRILPLAPVGFTRIDTGAHNAVNKMTAPNGNPGIVPPWLQNDVKLGVIGIAPVDPDTPTIM